VIGAVFMYPYLIHQELSSFDMGLPDTSFSET
jgi:hypothetical protein